MSVHASPASNSPSPPTPLPQAGEGRGSPPASPTLRVAIGPRLLARLHGDQQGTISILSVFALMFLVMLLGMVMNVGRHVDGKIRMQNAADAAAYSGGTVVARGMNTLAFTNHLLCDVFALTAFLREARDRNSESYAPAILAAWSEIGPIFESSKFPKFEALGRAITQKVPREQEMVRTYSEWSATVSSLILPLMEQILADELIPKYQRAVVEAFPDIAQAAALESAAANGVPDHGRGQMVGVLWRTTGLPVGITDESGERTLPVVDPVMDARMDQARYFNEARRARDRLAQTYLNHWNNEMLSGFDQFGKMSQFGRLWRGFTCGYLRKLCREEYPASNLPMVILANPRQTGDSNQHVEQYYTFIGVVYWKKLPELLPGLFRNPLEADGQAFAAVNVMLPQRRLVWHAIGGGGGGPDSMWLGGVPGEGAVIQLGDPTSPDQPAGQPTRWVVGRQGWVPTDWTLWNQNWNCQLVPATQAALPTILQSDPGVPAFQAGQFILPKVGQLTAEDISWISTH